VKPVFAGAGDFSDPAALASLPGKTRASCSNHFPGGRFNAAARFLKISPMRPYAKPRFHATLL
jgi:hypothetical protein